jgi:hypothetical protein
MLRRSQNSDEKNIQNIVESTRAIIFLGTPHRGSADVAALGDIVRRVASTILRVDTNAVILRALGFDSPELELCRESFITQWRVYEFWVKTFQEALSMTSVNLGLLNEKVCETVFRSCKIISAATEQVNRLFQTALPHLTILASMRRRSRPIIWIWPDLPVQMTLAIAK